MRAAKDFSLDSSVSAAASAIDVLVVFCVYMLPLVIPLWRLWW